MQFPNYIRHIKQFHKSFRRLCVYVSPIDYNKLNVRGYGSQSSSGNSEILGSRNIKKPYKRLLNKSNYGPILKRKYRRPPFSPLKLIKTNATNEDTFRVALAILSLLKKDEFNDLHTYSEFTNNKLHSQSSTDEECNFWYNPNKYLTQKQLDADKPNELPFKTPIQFNSKHIPISGLHLDFNVDLSNIKDILATKAEKIINPKDSGVSISTKICFDRNSKTIPLQLDSVVNGVAGDNSEGLKKSAIPHLNSAQINEYITVLAANLLANALQTGVENTIGKTLLHRKNFHTKGDNDISQFLNQHGRTTNKNEYQFNPNNFSDDIVMDKLMRHYCYPHVDSQDLIKISPNETQSKAGQHSDVTKPSDTNVNKIDETPSNINSNTSESIEGELSGDGPKHIAAASSTPQSVQVTRKTLNSGENASEYNPYITNDPEAGVSHLLPSQKADNILTLKQDFPSENISLSKKDYKILNELASSDVTHTEQQQSDTSKYDKQSSSEPDIPSIQPSFDPTLHSVPVELMNLEEPIEENIFNEKYLKEISHEEYGYNFLVDTDEFLSKLISAISAQNNVKYIDQSPQLLNKLDDDHEPHEIDEVDENDWKYSPNAVISSSLATNSKCSKSKGSKNKSTNDCLDLLDCSVYQDSLKQAEALRKAMKSQKCPKKAPVKCDGAKSQTKCTGKTSSKCSVKSESKCSAKTGSTKTAPKVTQPKSKAIESPKIAPAPQKSSTPKKDNKGVGKSPFTPSSGDKAPKTPLICGNVTAPAPKGSDFKTDSSSSLAVTASKCGSSKSSGSKCGKSKSKCGGGSSSKSKCGGSKPKCGGSNSKCGDSKPKCGSSKPKCGSSKPKCGSSKPKCGSSKPKCGSSKPKCGSSKPKCGSSKPKCGSSKPKCGSSKPKCGSSKPKCGSGCGK